MNINFNRRNFVLGHHPTWRFQIGSCVNEALQVAFKHLPYSHLRKCMQVSKSWRRLALEELQTRCIIHVSNVNHIKMVLQKLHGCANFRIGKCSLVNVGLDNVLLHKLFFKVQNSLHLLKLVHLAEIDELLLFKILNQLPNLTHLSVTSTTSKAEALNESHDHREECFKFPLLSGRTNAVYSPEKYDHGRSNMGEEANYANCNIHFKYKSIVHLHLDLGPHVAFQLGKIFQVFPNLIELAIANVREETRRKFLKSGEGLAAQYPQVKLKRLTLRQYSSIGFHEKLVQTLMRLNMHLEKLVVIFHPPSKALHSTSSLFRQFIESQGCSLKILKLEQVEDHLSLCISTDTSGNAQEQMMLSCVGPGKHDYYWDFNYTSPSISLLPMCLSNLQVLHVQKPLITNLAQVLHHFPSLKELSLRVCYGSNWKGMLPVKLEPHEKITRLKIDFIDSDSFARLGYCFPSLQTLQLSYCNESLFYVLCDSIPYFNGGGNLISCQQCHGTTQEFSVVKVKGRSDDETLNSVRREDAGVTGPSTNAMSTFRNNRCCPPMASSSTQNSNSQREKLLPREQRKKNPFKNLTLLTVRTCDHLPYEKFAFLQRENHSRTQSITFEDICNAEIDVGNCGEYPHNGFSWQESTIMDEHFVDFPVVDSSENESCSSA
ncbi:unnamed protein product [Orchesella dallaii]|uniref:F-box domain-containing protein n=1 Tax=Orchesella dallaii TaxID=48710 RepID=A0ABP1QUL8_9HEXA